MVKTSAPNSAIPRQAPKAVKSRARFPFVSILKNFDIFWAASRDEL
jgi:hypothetical protein